VIPPVTALLLTTQPAKRLALGWTVGVVGALVGVVASVALDLPAGPAVIATLASLLLVVALGVRLARR
jgi:ABC-type Mn2+/Zn2+ transport system permease subunit